MKYHILYETTIPPGRNYVGRLCKTFDKHIDQVNIPKIAEYSGKLYKGWQRIKIIGNQHV